MTTIEKLRNFEADLIAENKLLRMRLEVEREVQKKLIAERDKWFDEAQRLQAKFATK